MATYTEEQHVAAVSVYSHLKTNHRLDGCDRESLLDAIHTFEYAVSEGTDFPAFNSLYWRLKGHVNDLRTLVAGLDRKLLQMRPPADGPWPTTNREDDNENS
jgi:hypothetical protein